MTESKWHILAYLMSANCVCSIHQRPTEHRYLRLIHSTDSIQQTKECPTQNEQLFQKARFCVIVVWFPCT